eukprot:gnl/TRDRNA2_/TRDRNA2_92287_c0_seq1.p1 gnl/TRDRNA2_/TRDRNA2_92287_c0~~gnl/TRDRNA2_/TRDRNA2_92287_c0_seq1.p1  ORF type:complete len:735 (+),score=106.32 gnl/TRDRNA2_/TRDRNA2_92287_c0_seq1:319-2205(+)
MSSVHESPFDNTTIEKGMGHIALPRISRAISFTPTASRATSTGMCSAWLPRTSHDGAIIAGNSMFASEVPVWQDHSTSVRGLGTNIDTFVSSQPHAGDSPLRRTSVAAMATLQSSAVTSSIPSWQQLEEVLRSRGRDYAAERLAIERGERGPHTDAKLRLFGQKESDVRVTLYRDTAAWCPYCQKTWMLLEEKQIPFRVEKINMRSYGAKPQEFLNKVPSGLLPAIQLDGQLMTDSQRIMMTLESVFNGPEYSPAGYLTLPRIQADSALLKTAEGLLGLERELFGAWCQWCFRPGDGPGGMSRSGFEKTMDKVEAALAASSGAYFLGDEMSIVDLVYVPHLERIAASIEYWKGVPVRGGTGSKRWPQINAWFDALETRENGVYMATQSDWYTHVKDIPPQYGPGYFGGDYASPEGQRLLAAIDGGVDRDPDADPDAAFSGPSLNSMLRGLGVGSLPGDETASNGNPLEQIPSEWRLPLPALAQGPQVVLPSNDPGDDEAKLQAAERLVFNHDSVIRFALRGAGQEGSPAYSAPLADPNAVPSEDETLRAIVDELLRSVAAKMIGENHDSSASPMLASGSNAEKAPLAMACVDYLRGRVGVPRDMRLPAARQFRAHLTWAMEDAMKVAA